MNEEVAVIVAGCGDLVPGLIAVTFFQAPCVVRLAQQMWVLLKLLRGLLLLIWMQDNRLSQLALVLSGLGTAADGQDRDQILSDRATEVGLGEKAVREVRMSE